MINQLATPLLAACIVQALSAAPATMINNAAVSSPKTQVLLSTPTTNNNKSNKKHRLLMKFKKRQDSEKHGGENADVGVLSKSNTPRFLEEEDDYEYYCPRETCPEALCDCAEKGGSLEDCTSELKQVCHDGLLGDCVYKSYVQVYQEVYCPFVACVAEGFREKQCDCAFYDLYCARLNSNECTPFLQTEPDKKPFFGCDETELSNVCSEATSCKSKGDLQGLPELGTWKGSVQTGIKPQISGERVGGPSVVAGVTLLSMLWLMVNV